MFKEKHILIIVEYSIALFWEFILSLKIFTKKRFQVIQGCNPPDLIFLIALFYKFFGVKYVFDHHDINPELYISKYDKKDLFYKFLLLAERLTFATANYSIATNESYKEIAIKRGKMPPERVQAVRSGPKLDRLKPGNGNIKYKKGREFLIGYVGVIGSQEGLDLLLESAEFITTNRKDVQFAIIGDGTELSKIKELARKMELDDYIDFYGTVDDLIMVEILNTADICVKTDTPPIVQFDLKEGRLSAQEASLYADNTSTKDFADKIIWLLDNKEERIKMGECGYERIINNLSWNYESQKLSNLYQKVLTLNK
jgi:glycosyltransferase involved in cell wall biosynthesis